MPVSREIEHNCPRHPFGLAAQRLVDRDSHRMGRFRGGNDAFVFVVNTRGDIEGAFEAAGAVQRRGSPGPKRVADFIRNVNPAFLTDFLYD